MGALHVPVDGSWTALVKRDATPQAPAGSVSSSVRDLAQWMRLELGNGSFEGQEMIPADHATGPEPDQARSMARRWPAAPQLSTRGQWLRSQFG